VAASSCHPEQPTQSWLAYCDQLEAIDLRNPRVGSPADLLPLRAAIQACGRLVAAIRTSTIDPSIPDSCYLWAAAQAPWWNSVGQWYFAGAEPVLRGPLLFCGPITGGDAANLALRAAAEVTTLLRTSFALPAPKYALLVRFFDTWQDLPVPIAQAFQQHHQSASVCGLTLPPRFIVIPTRLPSRQWLVRDEVLIGERGEVKSPLILHDILVHELVHAQVHSLLAELAEQRGDDPLATDLPLWLDEGLAVYVTESLLVEPGSKPVSYYHYSAPLHYIADEWGEDTLRLFVRTAVLDSYPTALRKLGITEDRLRQCGEEYLRKRRPFARTIRDYAYLMAFLLLLVLLAAAPLVVTTLWQTARAKWYPPSARELEDLWQQFHRSSFSARSEAAARFLSRYRRSTPALRHEFAWRRCKLYLFTRH
jgi:hypothetical protein